METFHAVLIIVGETDEKLIKPDSLDDFVLPSASVVDPSVDPVTGNRAVQPLNFNLDTVDDIEGRHETDVDGLYFSPNEAVGQRNLFDFTDKLVLLTLKVSIFQKLVFLSLVIH